MNGKYVFNWLMFSIVYNVIVLNSLQIAELDDKLQQTQSQLGEMTLQYRHADQQCKKQSLELQSKTAKLQELEKVGLYRYS